MTARDRALALLQDPTAYQWEDGPAPDTVRLHVLSARDGAWHCYAVTEAYEDDAHGRRRMVVSCSCPASVRCYHIAFLSVCGGIYHVRRRLADAQEAPAQREARFQQLRQERAGDFA